MRLTRVHDKRSPPMKRLVRDLADASHLEGGSFHVFPGPNDLTELAREQVELAQDGADTHQITIEAPSGDLIALCDRDRVSQVISNLLTNAVKYAPGGKIRVALCKQPSQAVIK